MPKFNRNVLPSSSIRPNNLCSREDKCDECLEPTAKVALKRCAGCSTARYCSKECQKAAWRSHKKLCISRSADKVPPAYANLANGPLAPLDRAAEQWASLHKLSLLMLINVLVENEGGVDAVLNSSKAVMFRLGQRSFKEGTPATEFNLTGTRLERLETDSQRTPDVTPHDSPAPTFCEAIRHPDFVGFLPTVFYIQKTKLVYRGTVPLYRPRARADRVAMTPEATQDVEAMRMDLCWVISSCINSGLIFQAPRAIGQVFPDIGNLEAAGKTGWVWSPMYRSQEQAWCILENTLKLDEAKIAEQAKAFVIEDEEGDEDEDVEDEEGQFEDEGEGEDESVGEDIETAYPLGWPVKDLLSFYHRRWSYSLPVGSPMGTLSTF